MKETSINRVLLIGNGAMARNIGLQCALFGCEAVVYVRNASKNQEVLKSIEAVAEGLIADNWISESKGREALCRISISNAPEEACNGVDLVSESVAETTEIKLETWKKFAPFFPPHTILTTNSSSIVPSVFAEASGAPERFLSWHFHLPVFKQNLVDIMGHKGTDMKYVEALENFSRRIGQNYCTLRKECGGFLANNMLFVVLDKALELYLEGAAGFEEIDRAWMTVRLENSGPFGIMDKIGLDVILELLPESENKNEKIKLINDKVDRGESGVKSGKGFYKYPNPSYTKEDFVLRAKRLL